MDLSQPQARIAWRSVYAIAWLQAAISFGWVAYGACQPAVLDRYQQGWLILPLTLLQGVLGAVIEPLMGNLYDRQLRRRGSRFLLIGAGVTVTGVLFISVAISLKLTVLAVARWLLPALMLLWVAAMNTFKTPSVALLKDAAPTRQLPEAAALLSFAGGAIAAAGPLIVKLIFTVGDVISFMLGGAILVLSALPLRAVLRARAAQPARELPAAEPVLATGALLLFLTGAGVGFAEQGLFRAVVPSLQAHYAALDKALATSVLLAGGAVLALPSGRLVSALGVRPSLRLGMVGMALAAALAVSALPAALACAIGAAALAVTGTCAVPFGLSATSASRPGLGIGLFSGGIALAIGICSYFDTTASITLALAGGGATIALGAGLALDRALPARSQL
jgi:hypothetical protein